MQSVLVVAITLLLMTVCAKAQVPASRQLHPQRVRGGHILKRNLDMGDYTTTRFRRTLGSFFSFSTPHLANLLAIEGVPLYRKERRHSKDVYRFQLAENGTVVSEVECDAVFRKKETFRLLGRQDSSFFGKANVDYLGASIQLSGQKDWWDVVATNLHGSKNEEQKGIIQKGDQKIRFKRTALLLHEKTPTRSDISSLMTTLQTVYAFTINDEVVGAVSFRRPKLRLWLKPGLDNETKTVISSVAAMLVHRRNLYR